MAESEKRGTVAAPRLPQTWPSPARERHGAAMQVSHVFINKMTNDEESAQKTGQSGALGLLLAAASLRSKPTVAVRARGAVLESVPWLC